MRRVKRYKDKEKNKYKIIIIDDLFKIIEIKYHTKYKLKIKFDKFNNIIECTDNEQLKIYISNGGFRIYEKNYKNKLINNTKTLCKVQKVFNSLGLIISIFVLVGIHIYDYKYVYDIDKRLIKKIRIFRTIVNDITESRYEIVYRYTYNSNLSRNITVDIPTNHNYNNIL